MKYLSILFAFVFISVIAYSQTPIPEPALKPGVSTTLQYTKHWLVSASWNINPVLKSYSTGTPAVFGAAPTEACQPCHTPHRKLTEDYGYLWNHDIAAGPFDRTEWSSSAAFQTEIGDNSMKCLGCHDGVTALDAFGGRAVTGAAMQPGTSTTYKPVIGTNLNDDHPIGVRYMYSTDAQGANTTDVTSMTNSKWWGASKWNTTTGAYEAPSAKSDRSHVVL